MTHPTADRLAAAVGRAPARTGAFRPGEGAFIRGRPLHEACADGSWFGLALLALTGRRQRAVGADGRDRPHGGSTGQLPAVVA